MSDGTLPAPAWYDDPTVPGQQRWWDGVGWTEHVQQAAPPEPEPQPAWLTQEFATPEPAASTSMGYAPMASGASTSWSQRNARSAPTRWGTVSAWLLAFSPWANVVIGFILAGLIPIIGDVTLLAAVIPGLWVVVSLLIITWAILDRRALYSFGYERPPHWAWIFLSPLAYLIVRYVRTRAEARKGSAPLWLVCINIVAYLTVATVTAVITYNAESSSVAVTQELEAGIEQGFAEAGITVDAVCAEGTAFAPNKKFGCTLTRDDGTPGAIQGTWGATIDDAPTFTAPQFYPR